MGIKIVAPEIAVLTENIRAAEELLGRPEPILKAFGVVTLSWIGLNFREGGRPKWRPLTDWTLAGRREGRGKPGSRAASQSAQPLQNNGYLRNSFDFQIGGRQTTIFSNSPVAHFHEFGTKGPYEIKPKHAKALALPFLDRHTEGPRKGKVKGQYSLEGLGRSKPTGRGGFYLDKNATKHRAHAWRAGKTVSPYKEIDFRLRVIHPGIPARPMLPRDEQIIPQLNMAAKRLIGLTLQYGGGGADTVLDRSHATHRRTMAAQLDAIARRITDEMMK